MATMEHRCVTCGHNWSNNQQEFFCPKCGHSDTRSTWDEEHDHHDRDREPPERGDEEMDF